MTLGTVVLEQRQKLSTIGVQDADLREVVLRLEHFKSVPHNEGVATGGVLERDTSNHRVPVGRIRTGCEYRSR
jgi:hypothetical protein